MSRHPLDDMLVSFINKRIHNNPRSLQKVIGPSEVGHPCDRRTGYKLAGVPQNGIDRDQWRPTVGVAVHQWLADTFKMANELLGKHVFEVEERVMVGQIRYGNHEYDVHGSSDLFVANTVVDWKIVGKTTLDKVKKTGDPGPQYVTQAHTYGRGWELDGHKVTDVAIMYLPASGTLDDRIYWTEPYNETVALVALARVSRIQGVIDNHGAAGVAELEPTESYCLQCPWYRRDSEDLSTGCPGAPGSKATKPTAIHNLLG